MPDATHPTPEPSCPCGGRCHHSESPCSLGCWAAQKPWRPEEEYQRGLRAATPSPDVEGLREALDELSKQAAVLRTGDVNAAHQAIGIDIAVHDIRLALAAAKPSPEAGDEYAGITNWPTPGDDDHPGPPRRALAVPGDALDPYRDYVEHERQSTAGTHLFDPHCAFCFHAYFDAETRAALTSPAAAPTEPS